jgi:peptidoglycan/LPS O-acetylase OafA/YrhL
VQAFFVVSGFLVTMSFETSSSLKSYASKRLRRIAPAYVMVVVAAALLLSAVSTLPATRYFTSSEFWRYLGFNLILSNFSAPSLPGVFQSNFETAVNGSLWTIKIEVAFYCAVPFMVWAARRFGYRATLVTVFVASLLWKLGFSFAADASGVAFYAKLAKQLPGQLCFFAGGAWAFYRTREGAVASGWLALLGVLVYALSEGLLHDALAPIAVTATVYWAAVGAPRLPRVGKHGDFSYGVYLYHFPLVQVFVLWGLFQWSAVGASVILLSLVSVVAVLSWRFVEEPMLHKRVTSNALRDAR